MRLVRLQGVSKTYRDWLDIAEIRGREVLYVNIVTSFRKRADYDREYIVCGYLERGRRKIACDIIPVPEKDRREIILALERIGRGTNLRRIIFS